MLDSGLHIP
ncbi:unnamed protein product, partial [Rotaria sordida]